MRFIPEKISSKYYAKYFPLNDELFCQVVHFPNTVPFHNKIKTIESVTSKLNDWPYQWKILHDHRCQELLFPHTFTNTIPGSASYFKSLKVCRLKIDRLLT